MVTKVAKITVLDDNDDNYDTNDNSIDGNVSDDNYTPTMSTITITTLT